MRSHHSFILCNKLSQRLFLINLCFFSKDPHTFFLRWLEWLFFYFIKDNFSSPLHFLTDRVESEHQAAGWLQRWEAPTRSLRPSGESPLVTERTEVIWNKIAKSVSLPVQLWKAQKIKQVSGWPRYFCRGSNYTCSLWPPDILGMMSRSVHTGHHSPRHRREDLHAISNVRYELRWRSLRLKIPLFSQFDFLSPHQSFCPFCI